MAEARTNNFVSGSNPLKSILLFGIPNFLAALVNIGFSFGEGMILGKSNSLAFTTISLAGYLIYFASSFASGFGAGASVITSEYVGEENEDTIKKSISSSFYIVLAFALFTSVLTIFLTPTMVNFSSVPSSLVAELQDYLYTVFALLVPLSFFSSYFTSLLRSLGDPKPCFYVTLFSCLVNIGLDFFFIWFLNMGAYSIALGEHCLFPIDYSLPVFPNPPSQRRLAPKKRLGVFFVFCESLSSECFAKRLTVFPYRNWLILLSKIH